MTHCSVDELRTGLANATKETHNLWEENKDLQGRFVNDLNEISRIQQAIAQLEREHRQDQLQHARHSMTEMQRRASQLYSVLTTKREEIVKKLNDGTNFVALLQNQLISERLFDWKNRQKLAQVGVPFDNRDVMLDEIQMEFEFLAEQNWQLHMFASWTLDLLTRGPQVNDSHAHSTASNLTTLADQLTKLLFMLISQSFVVSVQPEPVLKTQHKFVTEVRLLIGDKLGIRQHLVNTNVTVKIIAEEEAKLLSATQMNHKDIKTVGSISNDYEKMTMDERGHMAAKFNNSKLTRIAHRKPPPKGAAADMKCSASAQAATDQKYALLFHISPFQLGNLGKFDVWTLSLPLMVTVHGSQDCDAQGAIIWHRAFASVSRSPGTTDITAVAWKDLAHVLRHKFTLFTGARRPLSDSDLNYLSEKLLLPNVPDQKPITFHRFAKQNLRDDVSFSFWEWFFSIMQLIKQKLLKFWDEGWLVGFISKQDASQSMMLSSHPTFLLRFSDTQTGAVSIGFVCEDDDGQKVPFHLAPFSIKDLDQLSLAQRIASCPQLKEIKYLYPHMDKDEMLRYFDSEERNRGGPDSPTGYIQSEIVMVAKTTNKPSSASVFSGGDSPSPLSVQSKLDWSPGEVIQPIQSMDIGDDLASMLSSSGLDGCNNQGDVESLLGPGFRPQLPSQPLQHVDLSFVDSYNNPAFYRHE
ncbi:hypothetical protein Y032_0189g1188 [Ancylostoma ceylanicum]|nr:hypothetical protein Y032_0189g1188 [Ancylostoma ceylanicum]